ncbi:MAG: Dabb family protein [Opitutae bacterium]
MRHIVCLKFKNEAPPDQVSEIEKKFPALQQAIPGIVSIEWGTNNSPEGLNKDFSHCFIVTFENEEARTTYLPHPDHQAFVDFLKPLLEDVFVIDFNL